MSIIVKIDRNNLRVLLDFLKKFTSEVYISFKYDDVEFSFFDGKNRDSINIIDIDYIDYESYVHDLKEDDVIRIAINPFLLFEKIDELPKNEFISLSRNSENNLIEIKSIN